MKKKIISLLWITLAMLTSSLTFIRLGSALPSATRVYVDPATVVMDPDGFFTVDIKIEGAQHVAVWQFKLYYDPGILFTQLHPTDPTKQWVTVGDFLSSPFFFTASVYPGHVEAEAFSMSFSESSGSGTLASVKFQVIGTGRSFIDLRDTEIFDLFMTVGQPDTEEDGEFYTTYPKASFIYSTENHPSTSPGVQPRFKPVVNETITFNASVISFDGRYTGSYDPDTMTPEDPDGEIVSYTWDFGDDTDPVTEPDPVITHAYDAVRSYRVNLTVTDNEAKQDSDYKDVSVVIHDLAITNIEVTPTTIRPGQKATIDVTVLNKGTEPEAGFNVTTYYDSNLIWYNQTAKLTAYSSPLIWNDFSQTWGITLDPGEDITITWTWNTTGVSEGTYNLKANVTRVQFTNPKNTVPGETLLADNEYHFGNILLPLIATVNIDPDILNLKSRGQWITAYIELPEGYDVGDIDISTVMLSDTIPVSLLDVSSPEPVPTEIGDYDEDGIPDLMVKFDRASVQQFIYSLGITYSEVSLAVTGEMFNGTPFWGTDVIFVNYAGDVNSDGIVDIFDIEVVSSHWYPGPPTGTLGYDSSSDFNKDGTVDIFDIGILSVNWGQTTPT